MNRPIALAVVAGCIAVLSAAGLYHTHQVKEALGTRLEAAETAALAGEADKAEVAAEELLDFWEEREKTLLLYIRHDELDEIERSISELKYLIKLGDTAEFCSKLDQTHALIEHVWLSELPLLRNIL